MSDKLYELSYIKDAKSWAEPLSYSHSLDKLQQSVPCSTFYVSSLSNVDNRIVRQSHNAADEYPRYVINEVNFII